MSNKMRGEFELDLGGKSRRFVFNNNSIIEFEDLYGGPILGALGDQAKVVSAKFIRAGLTAGLRGAGAGNASLQEVGRQMSRDIDDHVKYAEAIVVAMLSALGKFEVISKMDTLDTGEAIKKLSEE